MFSVLKSCQLLFVVVFKVVTFQVVLVSNGDRSFILINYGDIAETGQVWLVSGVKMVTHFVRDVPIRFLVPPIRSESLNIEYLPIPSPNPILIYS